MTLELEVYLCSWSSPTWIVIDVWVTRKDTQDKVTSWGCAHQCGGTYREVMKKFFKHGIWAKEKWNSDIPYNEIINIIADFKHNFLKEGNHDLSRRILYIREGRTYYRSLSGLQS